VGFFWLDGFAVPAPAQVTQTVDPIHNTESVKMKRSEAIKKLIEAMRLQTKSRKTQSQYLLWVNKYLDFIESREWGRGATSKEKFQAFVNTSSNKTPQASLSNRKQAYFAIKYFYREVIGVDVDGVAPPTGKRDQKTFNILSRSQIQKLLDALPRTESLAAKLMYGTGMRINECVALRIKDIDFEHRLIYVQEGKGDKSRRVDLPGLLVTEIEKQIEISRRYYDLDQSTSKGGVFVPYMLDKKNQKLSQSWEWFWLFPHIRHGVDPETNIRRRHHIYDFTVQNAFKIARKKAKLPVYTTPHILRHCYATHYLEKVLADLPPIPNVGEFATDLLRRKMGHVDRKTTDIYIHLAMPKNPITDHSPISFL